MSSDGFFDDIEEPDLDTYQELEPELPEGDKYDAFNEDTFGAPLEGDWESEHDKLLQLEVGENGNFDGTLTKFDDFDDKFRSSDEELESKSRRNNNNVNNMNMLNNANDLFGNQNLNNFNSQMQSQASVSEMQFKLFQQLQMQQQQQLLFQQQQFQKNQLLQQQQKQAQQFGQQSTGGSSASISPHFGLMNQDQKSQLLQQQQQQQQVNSAMLAALVARNSQMQMPSTGVFNSNQFLGNNMDRKTPVNFNNQFNEHSNMNSNINQMLKNPQSQDANITNFLNNMKNMQNNNNPNFNNENDFQKIKSILEKMDNQSSSISSSQNYDQSMHKLQNEASSSNNNNNNNNNPLAMLSMLQQQNPGSALPKLPPKKVKTLEEIEAELMSSNLPKTSSNQQTKSNDKNNQNLNKFFPLLNNNNTNNNTTSNNNQNEAQILMQKQKQFLEQLAMNQKQQQQNSMLDPMNDLLKQQQQLMHMQQLMSSPLNLNLFLPPNFQSLNQQQKQMVLLQIQRNLQLSMMQQQQMMNQNQNSSNVNNNRGDMGNQLMNNDLNNNRYNDNLKNRGNMNNNNNMMMNNRNQMFNNQNQNRQGKNNNNNNNNKLNSKNNSSNGDKLAGMMTDKEKNWVTNVQMLQLQIDDPYKYDFYYTAWMLKKKQFSQRNTTSAGLKTSVIHSLDNKYNKDPKSYRPLTFENSLGKVTMSNFHHPRALIDVKSGDDGTDSELAGEISDLDLDDKTIDKEKNIDTILLEIEKMYQVLLNIDEIEHSILKANDEMRHILFQDRRGKVDKLASMLCTENFAHYLFVDKGKRLLSKCIPTFNLAQTKLILGFVMQYIYIIAKNNISLDELYSHISYAIDTQKFADLVDIVNQFVHLYSRQSTQLYLTIFSNKFCLSFLLKFFSKSDLINQDDFEPDQKTAWSCFLNLVLVGLTVVQPISAKPDGTVLYNINEMCQLNLNTTLESFDINKDIWDKNEMKLKELFTCV